MVKRAGFVLMFFVLLLSTAACGGDSSSEDDAATVAPIDTASPITGGDVPVEMTDFAFTPDAFTIKAGSTVTFVFTNSGAVEHEAVIGDAEFQDEHEAEMAAGGSMEEDSDAPEVEVQNGETGELTYTFDTPGTLLIGCHIPGHWDAGMKATVTVVE